MLGNGEALWETVEVQVEYLRKTVDQNVECSTMYYLSIRYVVRIHNNFDWSWRKPLQSYDIEGTVRKWNPSEKKEEKKDT